MTSSIQLAKEIRWADSGPVWRERIFWMAAGMLFLWYPAFIFSYFGQIVFCFLPDWQKFYPYALSIGLPTLLIGLLAAKGYLNRSLNLFWFFQSRPRLLALWFLLSVLGTGCSLIADDGNGHFHFAGWQTWWQGLFSGWLGSLGASALPLFLLIWLLPARNRKTVRSAELSTGSTFDLSTALGNWRNELSAQPQLTADDRRELERHLADSMAELQERGLSEEESFRQASQQMGSPQQLAKEFEKADPTKTSRERIFWGAVGILVFWQVQYVISCFMGCFEAVMARFIPGLHGFYTVDMYLFPNLVVLLVLVALIVGRSGMILRLRWFLQGRFRFALLLIFLAILCNQGQQMLIRVAQIQMHRHLVDLGTWMSFSLRTSFRYLEYGAGPLILAVWFLPKRYRKGSSAGLRLKRS